jgi:hypothetical protein
MTMAKRGRNCCVPDTWLLAAVIIVVGGPGQHCQKLCPDQQGHAPNTEHHGTTSLRDIILTLEAQVRALETNCVARVQNPPGPKGLGGITLAALDGEGPDALLLRGPIQRLEHWLFTLRAALSEDDAKLASRGGG